MKCNKTQNKWCINKHGASKIIDTFETYQSTVRIVCVGTLLEGVASIESSQARLLTDDY
jgi:hypothetical protein